MALHLRSAVSTFSTGTNYDLRTSSDPTRHQRPSYSIQCKGPRLQVSCAASFGGAATADPFTSTDDSSYSSSSAYSSSSSSTSASTTEAMERTAATLYELLGISRDFSAAEIKDAYRQLARRYHPDVRQSSGISLEESTRRFIEVQEAYEILSDPQRRAIYDFEMMHGRKRKGGLGHAKATWRPRQRDDGGEPLWENDEDEIAVKTAWRQQWNRQMDGLRSRGQPKSGSWAARMREQQQQQSWQAEGQGHTA